MAKRPKLVKIDDEMRRWCAALEEELSSWPDVRTKPMFGMAAYYRGTSIFTAIPRTRAPGTDRSILIKLPGGHDRRLRAASVPGAGWVTCEIGADGELEDVLRLLGRAYEQSAIGDGPVKSRRSRPPR